MGASAARRGRPRGPQTTTSSAPAACEDGPYGRARAPRVRHTPRRKTHGARAVEGARADTLPPPARRHARAAAAIRARKAPQGRCSSARARRGQGQERKNRVSARALGEEACPARGRGTPAAGGGRDRPKPCARGRDTRVAAPPLQLAPGWRVAADGGVSWRRVWGGARHPTIHTKTLPEKAAAGWAALARGTSSAAKLPLIGHRQGPAGGTSRGALTSLVALEPTPTRGLHCWSVYSLHSQAGETDSSRALKSSTACLQKYCGTPTS